MFLLPVDRILGTSLETLLNAETRRRLVDTAWLGGDLHSFALGLVLQ